MIRRSRITADYRDAGPMSELINLCGFIDDSVFLTKGGDLGMVLAVAGVDDECLDAKERDAVTERFETALRLLDEDIRLYQFLLKRAGLVLERAGAARSPRLPANPAIANLLGQRQRLFEAKRDDCYSVTIHWVVLISWRTGQDSWRGWLSRCLSRTATVLYLDSALERRRLQLRYRVEAFVVQVADTLQPRVLSKHEAFAFFRQLVNYGAERPRGSVYAKTHSWIFTCATRRSSATVPISGWTTITYA